MATKEQAAKTVLRVVDALDHPHGGRILRTRMQEGDPPSVKALPGARLKAEGPRGETREVEVLGFSLTGGKVSDASVRETGRMDLHVSEIGEGAPVSLQWTLRP